MGFFRRKKKLSPEVIEAKEGVIAVLRRYRPYAVGDGRDEDLPEFRAFWAATATLQSGHDEVSRLLNGHRTEMFTARELGYLDLLLKGGNEDVRTEILMTYSSA